MITPFHLQLSTLTRAQFGFDASAIEQGSPEWLMMKAGVISASRAEDLIGRDKSGKNWAASHKNYRRELAAEILTQGDKERTGSRQMDYGHKHEASAREIFALHCDSELVEIPFIYGDMFMRYGCSPDALLTDCSAGLEIKNPWTSTVYLAFRWDNEIKQEYIEQCQFSMFVTGLPIWHFCNYDPRMKVGAFHQVVIERNESRMATFRDAVDQLSFDLDSELAREGKRFGFQWEPLKSLHATQPTTEEL